METKGKAKLIDSIENLLTGEKKQNALAFAKFLIELRMTPQWASENSWSVSYRGKRICYIKILIRMKETENLWYIRPAIQYEKKFEEFCVSEHMEQIMLENVHYCISCGKCAPGKTVVFWGKKLEHVCCAPIDFEFHNPDSSLLEYIKRIIIFQREKIVSEIVEKRDRREWL